MNPFTQKLAAFALCMVIGCGLSIALTKLAGPAMTIPAIHMVQSGEILEIAMEVFHGWCAGENCGDYTIIFQRPGREDYYSAVTKIESYEVNHGDMLKTDFELLAHFVESQSFFELDSSYPKNAWCTDCLITRVSVLKDGRRKKIVSLMPLQLWTIHRSVEGVAQRVQWLND